MKKIFIFIFIFTSSFILNLSAGNISILYPIGNENIIMGTDCIISWTSDNNSGNVKLEYSTDGGFNYQLITSSTENNGAYTWKVPSVLSDNCFIKITDLSDNSSSKNNAPFSITKPIIKVFSPNNGDSWLRAGWQYKIKWETIGEIDKVNIEFSSDGGTTFSTIANNVPNQGSFTWSPPAINTDNAIIRITDPETGVYDTNDSPFHILNITNTANVKFTVTVPSNTPSDDFICIGFDWREPVKMTKIGENKWQTAIDFYGVGDTISYRFCRNCECGGADEYFEDSDIGWRNLTVTGYSMSQNDIVNKWRWLPDNINFTIDNSSYVQEKLTNLPRPSFMSGIMLPDWWKHVWIDSLDKTFDKIINNAKATWVEYAPIPEIIQFYPYPIIVREGNNSTPDEDLITIIQRAHKKGLKVFLNPFPWALNVQDTSPQYHSEQWWRVFETEWRKILLHYAKIAQEYGVELFEFRMWPSIYNISSNEKEIIDRLSENLLKDLKKIYKGKIAVEYWMYAPELKVFGEGDYLTLKIWPHFPWKLASSADSNADELLSNLRYHLDNEILPLKNKWGKNFIFEQIAACSYKGANTGVPYFENELYYFKDDKNVPIDLQEQADAYEAILHASLERDWIKGVFSFNYNYWDSVDKAPSIRSKPAEQVVRKWFEWASNGGIIKQEINNSGWSLNSVIRNNSINVETLDTDNVSTVWKWGGSYWKIWSPDLNIKELIKNYGLALINSINPGEGFWLNLKGAVDLPVFGEEYGSELIKLNKGWNLVGTGKNIAEDNILSSFPDIKTLWQWNGKSWNIWSEDNNTIQIITSYGIGTVENLKKGEGFWINK
jgi:hypothetical protein